MILPEVNILIYAFRADMDQHARIRPWLTAIAEGDAAFGISPLTLSALIRITTNVKAFRQPSTLEECFEFSKALTSQPNCRIVEPGERHWSIFKKLCLETETTGPRVTDAWFAALAIEHGCRWVTLDRDYARFPDLDWQTPEAA
ncbi:MAG: type II toxin-antitoxin system VapC family toxin [Pseudomonadota bacterium]